MKYTVKEDGTVEYSFTRVHVTRVKKTYWTGTLEDDGTTLTGKCGHSEHKQHWGFVFKRVAPEVLIHRPHPKEFTEDRIKAFWKYALTATRNQVRRQPKFSCTWSYIKARRDVRKEYLALLWKEEDDRLTIEDKARISELNHHYLTFDDVRCFYVLQDYRQRSAPEHVMIVCDNCHDRIYGTRMICMECGTRATFDFCDKPACVGCTIKTHNDITAPHLPTHDFLKVRAPMLYHREIGKVLRTAKAGLERAKSLLEKTEDHKRRELLDGKHAGATAGEADRCNGADKDDKDGDAVEGDDAGEDGEGTEDGWIGLGPVGLPEKKVARARRATLVCLKCQCPISRPCWYCIDCPEDSKAFICWDCDAKEAGFDHGEHHRATHKLLRCIELQQKVEATSEEDGTEKRLRAIEDRMERMEKMLQSLVVARAE